jgi:hypothetical protein
MESWKIQSDEFHFLVIQCYVIFVISRHPFFVRSTMVSMYCDYLATNKELKELCTPIFLFQSGLIIQILICLFGCLSNPPVV